MMIDTPDRIRRKEAEVNDILKRARFHYVKNYSDLSEKKKNRIKSIKSLDR